MAALYRVGRTRRESSSLTARLLEASSQLSQDLVRRRLDRVAVRHEDAPEIGALGPTAEVTRDFALVLA